MFAPLYQNIATLNTLRRHVIQTDNKYVTYTSDVIHSDDSTIVMSRGQKGGQVITVLTNSGANAKDSSLSLDIGDSGYTSGTQLTDVLSCSNFTVDSTGSVALAMNEGQPMVLYSATALQNSSLCGMGGLRFTEGQQTVTMTTYTATVNSEPTMMVSSATVLAADVTATSTSTQSGASSLAIPAVNSLPTILLTTAVALCFGTGFLGHLLSFAG